MQKARERTVAALRVRRIILLLLRQVPQCLLRKRATANRSQMNRQSKYSCETQYVRTNIAGLIYFLLEN